MNERIIEELRRLADGMESGARSGWVGELTMSCPPVELDPMAGECKLDGLRHLRAGNEFTATLVLKAPAVAA